MGLPRPGTVRTLPDPSFVSTLQPCGGVRVEIHAFLPSEVYVVNVKKRVSHILTLMRGVFNMLLL